jgi:plastocyanin
MLVLIALLSGAGTSLAQDVATLKIKFVVDGKVPEPAAITNIADAYCTQTPLKADRLLVGAGGELANLALIFDEEKSKLKVPEEMLKVPAAKIELDNNKCQFNPKVIVARSGQTIVVKNSDDTGHNANFQFLKNPQTNFLIPAKQSRDLELKANLVEPTAMPIDCNVHPWMKAFVIVKQHPYVGVTNDKGELEIKNLPVGKEAIFRVWHESTGSIDQLSVDGKPNKLARGNRWEMELKPGMNDLGVVKIDAKLFK